MFKFKFFSFVVILFLNACFLNVRAEGPENKKQVLISERVLINTDRRVYIAGENLLYNMFLVSQSTGIPVNYPSIGYVVLTNTQGSIFGRSQVKIVNGKAHGAIYISDTLKSGFYQLTAYTNFMRNGHSGIFCKHQILIANRFDKDFFGLITSQNQDQLSDTSAGPGPVMSQKSKPAIEIFPGKQVYNQREKAAIRIGISDPGVKFVDFSVSVVEKNYIEESLSNSGWAKKTDNIPVYFDATGEEKPVHLAEDKYTELLGRLTDATRGNPVGYNVLYLSSPDTVNNFKYTVTNPKGYFRFPLTDYYNGKDLFIKIKQRDGESINPLIEIDQKFQEIPFRVTPWPVDSTVIRYLRGSQDIVRIRKSFSLIQPQYQPYEKKSAVPLLFNTPDYSVKPADYVELKDFIEISREIVPPLKIRKRDNIYFAEVIDLQQRQFMPPRPLIFLDGVLIDDISQVIPFGTREIKKVDVISSQWIIDHQVLDGVLSIISHNNLWKNITLNNFNLRVKAENYYRLPNQFQPNYSVAGMQSREPDFRQVLYWNPEYRVNAGQADQIEFFTSDYAAPYLIKVSGITDKGEIVEAYGEFAVQE